MSVGISSKSFMCSAGLSGYNVEFRQLEFDFTTLLLCPVGDTIGCIDCELDFLKSGCCSVDSDVVGV